MRSLQMSNRPPAMEIIEFKLCQGHIKKLYLEIWKYHGKILEFCHCTKVGTLILQFCLWAVFLATFLIVETLYNGHVHMYALSKYAHEILVSLTYILKMVAIFFVLL